MSDQPSIADHHDVTLLGRKKGIVYAGPSVFHSKKERSIKTKKSSNRSKDDAMALDVACGSRMFYFEKETDDVIFMDNRELTDVLCDGRTLNIHPDVVADFRNIPYPDGRFNLVIFDPPHIPFSNGNSWMAKKYGSLTEHWQDDIRKGFCECMRVLRIGGVLVFKWNEDKVSISDVLKAIGQRPLFGNRERTRKTIWMVYMKTEGSS